MDILNFLFGDSDSNEDLTVNDFDNWGMNDDWSGFDESAFDDAIDTTTGFVGGVFDLTNNLIDGYYDTQLNQAVRQAQIEQVALENAVPKTTNVAVPQAPQEDDNTKLLITAGAVLVGLTLLTRGS